MQNKSQSYLNREHRSPRAGPSVTGWKMSLCLLTPQHFPLLYSGPSLDRKPLTKLSGWLHVLPWECQGTWVDTKNICCTRQFTGGSHWAHKSPNSRRNLSADRVSWHTAVSPCTRQIKKNTLAPHQWFWKSHPIWNSSKGVHFLPPETGREIGVHICFALATVWLFIQTWTLTFKQLIKGWPASPHIPHFNTLVTTLKDKGNSETRRQWLCSMNCGCFHGQTE